MREIPLLGGGAVFLRPLTPADGSALAALTAELSARSIYFRYHAPRSGRLTAAEVAYLTDVDQRNHAAWGVADGDKDIAVGRYVRLEASSEMAEVALAVLDPWQGRGLSKLLLAALMDTARAAGITRLGGAVMAENTRALRLFTGLGVVPRRMEEDAWWAEMGTDPDLLPPTPAAGVLRHYHRLLTLDRTDPGNS